MTPRPYRTGIAALLTVVALGAAAEVKTNDGPGLSLRIADEAAPAGSTVQIKIEVTEPKPISTGRGRIKPRGIAQVVGIVLMNTDQDTYGVALLDGDELSFNVTSPSSLFGTPADYPILGIAGTVANASAGTSFPLTIDPAGLGFQDPSGAAYPTEIDNGTLTVASGVVTIGDVSPGSSVVPAGGIVRITGSNFTPSTRLRLGEGVRETSIAEQRFISSNRIDVVLGQTTNMHGLRVRARNDEGKERSESEYFSYERTSAIGASSDAVLGKVVPLFAPASSMSARVDLPRHTYRRRRAARPSSGSARAPAAQTLGFALQNLQTSNASVTIELLDGSGNPYAINTVSVGPDRYLVREINEVFGSVVPPAAFRIRSTVPIQVLGLVADPAAGTAAALPPR